MSAKIRMNTEYRNKFYNRIKDVFEKEETQEQQAFMQSREDFNIAQISAFSLAKEVVERSYPKEDVATLRFFFFKYIFNSIIEFVSVFGVHSYFS